MVANRIDSAIPTYGAALVTAYIRL